jgi:hypothetical protein
VLVAALIVCALVAVDKFPPKSALPANVNVVPFRLIKRFVGSILPLAVNVEFTFLVINVYVVGFPPDAVYVVEAPRVVFPEDKLAANVNVPGNVANVIVPTVTANPRVTTVPAVEKLSKITSSATPGTVT